MAFLQFVNWHITFIAYIEEVSQLWDKSYLITVYDPFNMLLVSVCQYFVEDFCISDTGLNFLSCDIFVWFWSQGDGGLVE